jgi:hypothetical protein
MCLPEALPEEAFHRHFECTRFQIHGQPPETSLDTTMDFSTAEWHEFQQHRFHDVLF